MVAIKKGDVVRLKSGGPPMSVDNVVAQAFTETPGWNAHCTWFDGPKPMEKWFDVDILSATTGDVDNPSQ